MEITTEDLKVVEIVEHDDGSADLVLEISNHFKNEFKKAKGLKRFSKKAFERFVLETLAEATKVVKPGAVAIDFDGVINSYKSGFVAIDVIPDPPVDGAFEFIEKLLNYGFEVYIYSTRFGHANGTEAIDNWLKDHGMDPRIRNQIRYSREKPIAKVYIDDRAWLFTGTFPDIEDIKSFRPWHGGKSSSQK